MKIIPDYLCREQCDSIKGIFILLVFISHFLGYVERAGVNLSFHFNQMIVTLFLFYSGYGVMESIKKKGDDYIKTMPRRRILTTLINFDIAVFAFIVMNLLLGREMTLKQCLLSFICLESVGNSNWYIFAIICGYVAAFMACYQVQLREWGGAISLILLMGYVVVMAHFRDEYWYDTILVFSIGMMYSQYRLKIERIVSKWHWVLILVCVAIYFGSGYIHIFARELYCNVKALAFVPLIVIATMRVPIRNVALGWCGKNLFPLYIYQRIPMIVLFTFDPTGFASWRAIPYFSVSFFVTICIAKLYPRWKVRL